LILAQLIIAFKSKISHLIPLAGNLGKRRKRKA
jgi:hypothetical protein